MNDATLSPLERFQRAILSIRLSPAQEFLLFVAFTAAAVVLTVALLPFLVRVGTWGYLAAFIINGLSSATIIVPAPGFASVMLMARDMNPIGLGIAAGVGGALGELAAYWLGTQGQRFMEGHQTYEFMRRHMRRYGGLVMFVAGLVPFIPVDAAGILAGATRYPIPKFLLYAGSGKIIMTTTVMYLVSRAFIWAEPYLRWLA